MRRGTLGRYRGAGEALYGSPFYPFPAPNISWLCYDGVETWNLRGGSTREAEEVCIPWRAFPRSPAMGKESIIKAVTLLLKCYFETAQSSINQSILKLPGLACRGSNMFLRQFY
jgi:hypothetical protein